jgi:hypothetical protein
VHLRRLIVLNKDLRRKIESMEKKYAARFQAVLATINQRRELEAPIPPKRHIVFHTHHELLKRPNRPL